METIMEFVACWIAIAIGVSLLVGRSISYMEDTPEDAAARRADRPQRQCTDPARLPALP